MIRKYLIGRQIGKTPPIIKIIMELQEENKRLWKELSSFESENLSLTLENEKLIKVLEFYANKENYSYSDVSCPEILVDYGKKAREILKEVE